ncbi:hypothetical protein [Parvibaculum sp.]|jgi:hypothetical protein|uniref:hypothetical protein n=1 Tax=Parvibaculum sp. TaxID=2024848 RepID=UPI0025E0146E|nr:hypothetical protein [Parvibaculum sp.]|tara:strand:+ start:19178 stop:19354 length:177 start_codon:yes stop_codon:yes gene_type:complete
MEQANGWPSIFMMSAASGTEFGKAAGNAPEMAREQIATSGPIGQMLELMKEEQARAKG